jgi:hypothetical protein
MAQLPATAGRSEEVFQAIPYARTEARQDHQFRGCTDRRKALSDALKVSFNTELRRLGPALHMHNPD